MQIPLQVNFCCTSIQRAINAYLRTCSKRIFCSDYTGFLCYLQSMDGYFFSRVNTLGGGAHVVNPFTDIQFDKRVKNVLSMSWLLV